MDYTRLPLSEVERLAREGDVGAQAVLEPLLEAMRRGVSAARDALTAHARMALELIPKLVPPRLLAPVIPLEETFLGNLSRAQNGDLEAARRLARKWLCRSAVFHPLRWHLLRDRFADFAGERGEAAAWCDLVAQNVYLVFGNEALQDVPLTRVYGWVRRELRKEIERFLLDGQTLDAMREEPLPEDADVPDLEREVDLETLALREALARLSAEDLRLLFAEGLEAKDRMRKMRLLRKIADFAA